MFSYYYGIYILFTFHNNIPVESTNKIRKMKESTKGSERRNHAVEHYYKSESTQRRASQIIWSSLSTSL